MRLIQLTSGAHAMVDDDLYEHLDSFRWSELRNSHTSYAVTKLRGKTILMHRLVLNVVDAGHTLWVDHKNSNGLDNRIGNLRICSPSQNLAWARKRQTKATSRYKGVCYRAERGLWVAQIWVAADGRNYILGHYDCEERAARVYDEAARYVFGEFARLNFGSV
jgi:hypothetical protein